MDAGGRNNHGRVWRGRIDVRECRNEVRLNWAVMGVGKDEFKVEEEVGNGLWGRERVQVVGEVGRLRVVGERGRREEEKVVCG